jgi:nucleotide-binding universal stress UspA family protein
MAGHLGTAARRDGVTIMSARPSVICPIDFSEASRSALYHAVAIAEHFGAQLTVMSVDDPLLAEVAASAGHSPSLVEETERELRRFAVDALDRPQQRALTTEFVVRVGKPATEILDVAAARHADLIVMGSHGRSGVRKLFFGATTERVLRETRFPVLVTPDDRARPAAVADIVGGVRRVLAPVDLSEASGRHVDAAAVIARTLSSSLLLLHVLEPVFMPGTLRAYMTRIETARRAECEDRLMALAATHAPGLMVEAIVVAGDPADEIAKVARARGAGLLIVGLHSAGLLGPRMGSVTYRVLCAADTLVLALPPVAAAKPERVAATKLVSTIV